MKISEVAIYEVKLPNTRATGWNPVIVQIRTDEGITGLGEVALAYGSGASAGAGMVKNMAEGHLIGIDPFRIEEIWDHLYRKTFWGQGGGPVVFGAMGAIDEALWDIKGKALGVPVYELLGGACWEKLRVYANSWYNQCCSPESFAEAALKVVADGYTAMKFDPFAVRPDGVWDYPKRMPDRERCNLAFDRVRAVRDAVGPKIEILIEIHGNLGTTTAIHWGKRVEVLDPFFYEEPVDALNVACMKKVAENVDIPIAAGERLYTRYGFRQYIEQQALDILQPDVGLAGGISETRKIANYAETYNLHVQPHNCAGPVATAAALHVDACIPNFIIQEFFPYRDPSFYELVVEAYDTQAVDSFIDLPTRPGLGIELNEKIMAQYGCLVIK